MALSKRPYQVRGRAGTPDDSFSAKHSTDPAASPESGEGIPGGLEQGAEPRISVVVPVYNAMPYLTELLNSLEAQDVGSKAFELIAVDDGSTDYSGEILDVYAARNSNFRIIHQENSGWPGKPRNVGMAASAADFVFFCDADDVLGTEALRRMLAFADTNEVDVLTPKMVGLGGRRVQASLFRETVLDVPIRTMLRSLSPQKMIRRSLLVDNNIRFSEDKVRLEDGMVMSECYLLSARNSILADYDYYQIRTRADGANISQQGIDPSGYVQSLTRIAESIRSGLGDEAVAELAIMDLFKRKGLRFYEPLRFVQQGEEGQRQWVSAHSEFLKRFIDPRLDTRLNDSEQAKTHLIRSGDFPGLREFCAREASMQIPAEATSVEISSTSLVVTVVVPGSGVDGVDLVLRSRAGQESRTFEIRATSGQERRTTFEVALSPSDLDSFGPVLVDLSTVSKQGAEEGAELRLRAGARAALPASLLSARAYRTVNGSLSIDLRS